MFTTNKEDKDRPSPMPDILKLTTTLLYGNLREMLRKCCLQRPTEVLDKLVEASTPYKYEERLAVYFEPRDFVNDS